AYRKELNIPDKVAHSAKGEINNTRLGLEAFAASVKGRKPPVATVEHGRDAVLTCLLVREAVYQKKPITMKELRGECPGETRPQGRWVPLSVRCDPVTRIRARGTP